MVLPGLIRNVDTHEQLQTHVLTKPVLMYEWEGPKLADRETSTTASARFDPTLPGTAYMPKLFQNQNCFLFLPFSLTKHKKLLLCNPPQLIRSRLPKGEDWRPEWMR